ncbi:MAG: spore germination protein [Clostridia bacterium]|nr:spore germination protein [Clostridia bacterium]
MQISGSINENADTLRTMFDNSADLTLKTMPLRINGDTVCVLTAALEGLADKELIAVTITNRISDYRGACEGDVFTILQRDIISCNDVIIVTDMADAAGFMMSGFACVFVHGVRYALAVGVQGYAYRSVEEPQTEVLQRGSREGFCEPMKINQSMLRRRLKNTQLKFETMKIGDKSNTDVCLCYLRSRADERIIADVRNRLTSIKMDCLAASGFLREYLEDSRPSFFSGVGVTERPDTAAQKLCEGKVVIIVDGTPSVLVVPHIMAENFSTIDDYCDRVYFAALTRLLKYTAFAVSILLPGIYVALAGFSPEFFPNQLLTRVTTSVSKTPFSVFAEVLFFTFVYEIMREAGLRLPKTLGHAVSIIGGLVIGDTAVSSGFIGAPTLMIVALTVICSYVIPNLYAPVSILRLLFIIAGGVWGIWGVILLMCIVIADICSKESFGVPFMTPASPLDMFGMRDFIIRAPWKVLSKSPFIFKKEVR